MSSSASNFALVIPAPKTPLELRAVENYTAGPGEVLVKNEVIAFNPLEWKLARWSLFPIPYPSILGISYGGTVTGIGENVSGSVQLGDKIAVSRQFKSQADCYAAYQKFVVATEDSLTIVPKGVELDVAASIIMNIRTVFGALGVVGGLGWPRLEADEETKARKGKKILIYGGSSQVGSLAIQYGKQAGYTVVTTSSPQNHSLVSSFSPDTIINHTEPGESVQSALVAAGPYEFIWDTISKVTTTAVTAAILSHQGGGTLWVTVLPPMGDQVLPFNVKRAMKRYGALLDESEHTPLGRYLLEEYIPKGLVSGALKTLPLQKIPGGLSGVTQAFDVMQSGTSGVKLVCYPWEE